MDYPTPAHERPSEPPHFEAGAPIPIDHWSLLWQRKWLLLLGLLTGLGFGFLKYTREPLIYRSSAKIQIVEPYLQNMPVQGIEPGGMRNSIVDESMVIRSEKVLRQAAEIGELTQDELFKNASPEQIAARLVHGVRITPAGSGVDSHIFEIAYECSSPSTTQRVVQAVIDAYGEHLDAQHASVEKDMIELINDAQQGVGDSLRKLETEYDEFKSKSPLIYRGGQRTSIHRENADKFMAEQQELLIRITRLDTRLKATKEAIKNGDPPSAILLMLLTESSNAISDMIDSTTEKGVAVESDRIGMTRAQIATEQKLLPLELHEQELLIQYGAGHPLVQDIQSQIAITKGLIAKIEENEKKLKAEIEEARKSALELLATDTRSGDAEQQVQLHVLAMEQQLKAISQEKAVIDLQYDAEMNAARNESSYEIEGARFERNIARQQTLYDKIVARFDELDVMKEAEGLKVVTLDEPKWGGEIGPSLSRSLGFGGTVGLMFMVALAYLSEFANKAYRSAEEIAEHLKLPVLGHVPLTSGDAATRKAKQSLSSKLSPVLCTFFRSKSMSSEAYRAIRTALFFSNQGTGQQVLQITSAVPADGKTTIASNIAISIAQMGKSVLLVDADMRRPQVSHVFGFDPEPKHGLAWLLEQVPASGPIPDDLFGETILETEVANLSVMPSGERPDNPAELLSSEKLDRVIDQLRGRFDVILIDSPPLLAVTDPSNIAPRVDGVVMVIRLRKNARPMAAQAGRMLETLEAKVVGVVINGVGSREAGEYGKYARRDGYYNRGQYYQYGYGYTYGYSYYDSDSGYGGYYEHRKKRSKKSAKT